MRDRQRHADLIVDIGMSEGNDTAFYLTKGFRVVGIEADAQAVEHLRRRFAGPIADGVLQIFHFAASARFGETVTFHRHQDHPPISGIDRKPGMEAGYTAHPVITIDWNTIAAQWGVPHYLKVDIEGHEEAFLASLATVQDRPEYISVGCNTIGPAAALFNIGYPFFKLVDQNPPAGFTLPDQQTEGRPVAHPDWAHCSGPFGAEVSADPWLSFGEFAKAYARAQDQRFRTWFDCHAWMPVTKF